MRIKLQDLRYFGVLFLVELGALGTIVAGYTIWPNLMPLWVILTILNLLCVFPFAVWLDKRMPR